MVCFVLRRRSDEVLIHIAAPATMLGSSPSKSFVKIF